MPRIRPGETVIITVPLRNIDFRADPYWRACKKVQALESQGRYCPKEILEEARRERDRLAPHKKTATFWRVLSALMRRHND